MIPGARRTAILLVGLSTLFWAGCGSEGVKGRPPMGKVTGKVTYKGKPVSDASIAFILEGMPRTATGQTDAGGNFKLTTYETNDGAFVGTQKVTVVKVAKIPGGKAPEQMKPEDLAKMSGDGGLNALAANQGIPEKYSDAKTTPLKTTVDPGENVKEFVLED